MSLETLGFIAGCIIFAVCAGVIMSVLDGVWVWVKGKWCGRKY